MEPTTRVVAPGLRSLLEGFIDYAGIFPPAQEPLAQAVANYESYKYSHHSWMLRYFVVGAGELAEVPASLNGSLSVLAGVDERRAATIESNSKVSADRPVYWEVPVSNLPLLDEVKKSGCYAKIRAGGVKPEAIPTTKEVADFIVACAERQLPFKATAGLHHPIRSEQALTYKSDAPRATMHGFINVLLAAAFAWHGDREIEPIVAETDPHAFKFDESAHFKERSLSSEQIKVARAEFIHSVGSCSFAEPVADLVALGLL